MKPYTQNKPRVIAGLMVWQTGKQCYWQAGDLCYPVRIPEPLYHLLHAFQDARERKLSLGWRRGGDRTP